MGAALSVKRVLTDTETIMQSSIVSTTCSFLNDLYIKHFAAAQKNISSINPVDNLYICIALTVLTM